MLDAKVHCLLGALPSSLEMWFKIMGIGPLWLQVLY